MSWLKRFFNTGGRRARAAEGAGRWREAATLWAEADEPERAAEALMHLARRGGDLEERLDAWYDALRFLEEDPERRAQVEVEMSRAVLAEAKDRGVASAEERRRLIAAAERLERLEKPAEAAAAFELLGRQEDQARCLEAAGEVEALEALLDQTSEEELRASRLRRLLSDAEMAVRYGARAEARASLREASTLAPSEPAVSERLRRFEQRMLPPHVVRLHVDGKPLRLVGRLPVVLGRADADVSVRGTGVSRRHLELSLDGEGVRLRDLDSRNGTLVGGVPIRGSLTLGGQTEVGLGDDVSVRIERQGAALRLEVLSGLDRGEAIVVGDDVLEVPGAPASVYFDEGWAVLRADAGVDLSLAGQTCALPVHLLLDDSLVVGGVSVKVLA